MILKPKASYQQWQPDLEHRDRGFPARGACDSSLSRAASCRTGPVENAPGFSVLSDP